MIKGFEGCILHPYKDQVGVWTIGWGNTYINGKPVTATTPKLTQKEADDLLLKSIKENYEPTVYKQITRTLIQARNAYSNPSAIQSTYNVASTTSINSCLFGSTCNGEIVSAKPQIQITTKDENPYLALNDTATYQIYLTKLSDNTTIPIYFNNPNLQSTPATQQNAANQSNIAKVIFTPTLTQSGTYRLYIRSRDRSSNNFASNNKAYQIDFEIDTKPAISNMLNYPNPFTTSTQFVFTLTGSSIPQNLRIQIFTPSGKVVREITQNELGPLYIGKNITQYRWDGTDEFGSPLANGLYLYRIIAKLDQKELDHYDNQSIDSMFKNGIGKMYLVR